MGNHRARLMVLSSSAKFVFAVLCILPFVVYHVVTGLQVRLLFGSAMIFVALALPHEALHWLGHRLAGVDARLGWARGVFGTPTLAVGARQPQTLRSYRLALALPFLVLSVVPLGLGWVWQQRDFVLAGLVGLSMASSDLAVLVLTAHWPGTTRVRDHPEAVGVLRLD